MSSTKEAMAVGGGSRRSRGTTGPKAGSVWESRMKLDQVRGGIKVFDDATHELSQLSPRISSANSSPEPQMDKRMSNSSTNNARAKQGLVGLSGKRKTWKSDNIEGGPNPILQIARQRSESSQQLKEIIVCADDETKVKDSRSNNGGSEDDSDSDMKKMKSEPSNANSLDQLVTMKVPDEPNDSRSDHQHCAEKKAISSNVGRRIKTPSDSGEAGNPNVKEITSQELQKPKKTVVEEKKLIHGNVKSLNIPANQTRFRRPIPSKINPSDEDGNSHGRVPRTNGKLQSFVDLVMWRDASKSAFVFGIGTFAIISSSFTKGFNISFISVVSYLGLVYLAANFLFKYLITRGSMKMNNGSSNQEQYVVGEEEAIWMIKLFLPYVNEFLVNLRALFSGDPATTMKLAVLLFVLAQCGSSITIWKVSKLGFFGVFIVPKVFSSYSSLMNAYGTFWVRRFGDAWKSCSHKKVVGCVIFTLIWNLASMIARVWIVFMVLVALKHYQQSSLRKSKETMNPDTCSWQRNTGASPPSANVVKQIKAC